MNQSYRNMRILTIDKIDLDGNVICPKCKKLVDGELKNSSIVDMLGHYHSGVVEVIVVKHILCGTIIGIEQKIKVNYDDGLKSINNDVFGK